MYRTILLFLLLCLTVVSVVAFLNVFIWVSATYSIRRFSEASLESVYCKGKNSLINTKRIILFGG